MESELIFVAFPTNRVLSGAYMKVACPELLQALLAITPVASVPYCMRLSGLQTVYIHLQAQLNMQILQCTCESSQRNVPVPAGGRF